MSVFPGGVHFDVPIIDGDAMGRAYPTMYHGMFNVSDANNNEVTSVAIFSVYDHSLTPCVLSDARGNTSVAMVRRATAIVF